jgi:hypothetical protein
MLLNKLVINGNNIPIESIEMNIERYLNTKIHKFLFKANSNVEMDLYWETDQNTKIHVRDQIIEVFKDETKIYEMEIDSHQFSWAAATPSGIRVRFSGTDISANVRIRIDNFMIMNERMPFSRETVFKSHRDLRYHFIEAKDPICAKKLVVVFSAISPKYTYNYNYMTTLASAPMNQLYILDDFGDQGSYYIGHNRDHLIETSVISLILHIVSKLQITLKDVLLMGSSKGGYSALYYGIKYSMGTVLSLGPQTRLGDFLSEGHPNVAEYIANGNWEGNVYYLNELLYRLVEENRDTLPEIHLMVGNTDSHWENHVLPFTKHLEQKDIFFTLDLIDNVNHSELKDISSAYINRYIAKKFLNQDIPEVYVTKILLEQEGDIIRSTTTAYGAGLTFAHYWYFNNELIEKIPYSESKIAEIKCDKEGLYRVRVFVRNQNGEILTKSPGSKNVEKI